MRISLLMNHFHSAGDVVPQGTNMEIMKKKELCSWTIYSIYYSFASIERMRRKKWKCLQRILKGYQLSRPLMNSSNIRVLFSFIKETYQVWWFIKWIAPLYLGQLVSLPSWFLLGLVERCHNCKKITSFGETWLGAYDNLTNTFIISFSTHFFLCFLGKKRVFS